MSPMRAETHEVADSTVTRYVARALDSLFSDVARRCQLQADAPRHDPAVACEVIRQAALHLARGAGAEYGLEAEDAARLTSAALRSAAERVLVDPLPRVPAKTYRTMRPIETLPPDVEPPRVTRRDLDALAAQWSASIWYL